MHGQALTKDESPDLDALPTRRVLRRPRVNEGSVRDTAVGTCAVGALEQEALVVAHAAEVVPLLVGVVLDRSRVAGAVGVAMLDRDEVLVAEGRAVGEGQRVGGDGPVERAPHVDDAVAALLELVGLVGQVVLDAHRRRLGDLVNVGARDGRARGVGARPADGVVEDEDAIGAGNVVEDQLLHLGVVLLLDRVIIGELLLFRLDARYEGERVRVEVEFGLAAARVLDVHFLLLEAEVVLRHAFGLLLNPVVGDGSVRGGDVEVDCCSNVAARNGVGDGLGAGVEVGRLERLRLQLMRRGGLRCSGRHVGGWKCQEMMR